MRNRITLVILLVLVVALYIFTVFNTVSAETQIKPISVTRYDTIYDPYGGSGFWDDSKLYSTFFSPYSTQPVHVNAIFNVSFRLQFNMSPFDVSRWSYISSTLVDNAMSSFDVIYEDKLEGSDARSVSKSVRADYNDNTEIMLTYSIILEVSGSVQAGSLAYYDVQNYQTYGDRFRLYASITDLGMDQLFSNCYLTYFWYQDSSAQVNFNFEQFITSDNLIVLIAMAPYLDGSSGDQSFNPTSNYTLSLNGVDMYSNSKGGYIGGVFDINFEDNLHNQSLNFDLSGGFYDYVSIPDNLVLSNPGFVVDCYFGKVIPYSRNQQFTGGVDYGSWQSTSCDTFDIPCHIGNAIGYLIYEFPLTKPITSKITPLIGFFEAGFDVLNSFSGVAVVFGVISCIIVVSVVFAFIR